MVDTFYATCIRKRYPFLNSSEGGETDTLQVTVTDGANPVSGASVTINDSVVVTDENGTASFSLEYGDYTCTVACTGYESVTESLSFSSNHKNFSITLTESGGEESDLVTITVLDDTTGEHLVASDDVQVQIDTLDGKGVLLENVDDNGQVTGEIPNGTYNYIIQGLGKPLKYGSINGELTVTSTERTFTYRLPKA